MDQQAITDKPKSAKRAKRATSAKRAPAAPRARAIVITVPPLAPGADCSRCPAYGRPFVPPEAHRQGVRMAIVTESPSNADVGERRLGASVGIEKTVSALGRASVKRSQLYITSAALCQATPEHADAARRACLGRLTLELATTEACVIAPLGSKALQSCLASKQLTSTFKWRGFVHVLPDARLLTPMLAPWLVYTVPKWRTAFESDLRRAARLALTDEPFMAPEQCNGRVMRVTRTEEQLLAALEALGPVVSFDVETVGLGPTETRLTCFGMSDGKLTICVPWSRDLAGLQSWWVAPKRVAKMVTKACRTRRVVTHNGPAFDHIVAARYGIVFAEWDDTLLMMHSIDGHLPKGLAYLVGTTLDAPPWKQAPHSESVEQLWGYNMQDALYTVLAYERLLPRLAGEGMAEVYRSDKAMGVVCRDMQVNGFAFDEVLAAEYITHLQVAEAGAIAACSAAVGRAVNPYSPKDLGRAFTKDLRAPVYLRSKKTGAASFGIQALRSYAACPDERLSRLALAVISARSARKVRVTYIVNVVRGRDGRVHPSWLSYGTVTGRFACQAPNLANLPRAENDPTRVLGRGGIRALYVAEPGNSIVYFDVKQIEMRMAAYASGDLAMIEACESADMHASNATLVFGAEFTGAEPALRSQLRTIIKSAGFAICYLAEEETVYLRIKQTGIAITPAQVSAMMLKMRKAFRGYYAWQSANLRAVVKNGYIVAPISGRRRWLGHNPRPTECANFPIQSGAAGLMNDRLEKIAAALAAEFPKARLVAQVYDSCCVEAPSGEAEAVAALCKREFEQPIAVNGRSAVFPIDMEITERWH